MPAANPKVGLLLEKRDKRERKAEKGKMLNHQEFSIQDSWEYFSRIDVKL